MHHMSDTVPHNTRRGHYHTKALPFGGSGAGSLQSCDARPNYPLRPNSGTALHEGKTVGAAATEKHAAHLEWDVEIGRQADETTQHHGQDVGVDVLVPVNVDPHYSRGEQEYAGVLVARAQSNKQGSEA